MHKIKSAFFSSLIIFLCLMLPEIIYGFFNNRFQICWQPEKLAVVYILSLILTFTPYNLFKLCFIIFWGVCSLIQFCYMKYFGSYLTPYAINFIFLEFGDIVTETKVIWKDYIGVFILIAFCCGLLVAFCRLNVIRQSQNKYYPILYLTFFGYFFYAASTLDGIFQMLFKNTCSASYNTINSFSAFFANILPYQLESKKEQNFLNYEISQNDEAVVKNRNIIWVVGESTNAENMSLFGYAEDTTPNLKKYALSDNNFVYKTAWAAAVNTLISLPMMYNIQYHPKDYKKLVIKDSNLLRLASKNGYKVTYVELQNASVFRKTGLDSYDDLYVYDQSKDKQYKNEYEYLNHILPKISLEGKNFIIIHQRTVHSPYESNYIGTDIIDNVNSSDNPRVNAYNQAIRFEDIILSKLLKFAAQNKNETFFYYISDHGEALGQDGLWGHGHLDPADLQVPFLFTMFNSDDKAYKNKISNLKSLCAYQVSVLIAEKLGFNISIPNEKENICFVNGRNSMGRAGFLQIKINNENYTIEKKL